MTPFSNPSKRLVLGTTPWESTVSREVGFALLDEFYLAGFRWIETATSSSLPHGILRPDLALQLLSDWITLRNVDDLHIIVKVGDASNGGDQAHALLGSMLTRTWGETQGKVGRNLDSLWTHRDARDDLRAILDSLNVLRSLTPGQPIGLSDIAHPNVYAQAAHQLNLRFRILVKHNLLESEIGHYESVEHRSTFYAYGTSAESAPLNRKYPPVLLTPVRRKLKQAMDRSVASPVPLSNLRDMGLLYAYSNPEMEGLIVEPSTLEDLQSSMKMFRHLQTLPAADIARALDVFL